MTLITLQSPIVWPGIVNHTVTAPGLSNAVTLTTAGHYLAFITSAKEDMSITHVGFRAGTSAGSPTIEVRIETLDASGMPSGTLWATDTNGTTGTVTSNTSVLQALTATATITKGQVFCVKVAFATGTSQILQYVGFGTAVASGSALPYQVANTGTPTKSLFSGASLCFALGSSSTTFYQVPGLFPASAVGTATFNNTNSAQRGLRFTPPMDCRAIGIRWYNSNSSGNYNIALYNDAGTELSSSSTAFDGDHSALLNQGTMAAYFDSTVTLSAGTTYRIAVEPTSATNCSVLPFTLPSTDYRSATPAGTMAHYTTFASGSWTDTATDQLPLMDLIIDQIDDGTGSGSSGGGQRVISG